MNKSTANLTLALAVTALGLLLGTSSVQAQTTQDRLNTLITRGISGGYLQGLAMDRCAGIAPWNRPYTFDGVKDCYGYTRQVWNALLYDGSPHSEDYSSYSYTRANYWLGIAGGLPVATGPSDPNWASISSLGGSSKLLPGDVVGTTQGHTWGDAVHYGMKGIGNTCWQCYSPDGAYNTTWWTGFIYYYKPVHDILARVPTHPAAVTAGPNWNLRNTLTTGTADTVYHYGGSGDTNFVMGDWDGNGSMTPGIIRINSSGQYEWMLKNSNSGGNPDYDFAYGSAQAGDILVVGDWDGNGTWTPGIVRNTGGQWHWLLRNANAGGGADYDFGYGAVVAGDKIVVGDWDGNKTFTPGIVRGNSWMLRNSNNGGGANLTFGYGNGTTDIPIVGDWDGNGTWTCGVVRVNNWMLKNSNSSGNPDIQFGYGSTGNKFLVWK